MRGWGYIHWCIQGCDSWWAWERQGPARRGTALAGVPYPLTSWDSGRGGAAGPGRGPRGRPVVSAGDGGCSLEASGIARAPAPPQPPPPCRHLSVCSQSGTNQQRATLLISKPGSSFLRLWMNEKINFSISGTHEEGKMKILMVVVRKPFFAVDTSQVYVEVRQLQ